MFPFDEENEGEVSFGESSDAEQEMTPDIPEAPSVDTFDDSGDFESAGDVDPDTLRAFVVAVIYANIALLLVFLGPMVWYFEGWSRAGPALLAVGLLAGIRTYQTYRAWDQSREDESNATVDTEQGVDLDAAADVEQDVDSDAAVDAESDVDSDAAVDAEQDVDSDTTVDDESDESSAPER